MTKAPYHWFLYRFYLANLRIDRANHHLADLKRRLRAAKKPDGDLAAYYRYIDEMPEEMGELNAHQIHLIIGDLVSNLRTALNYSAIALAAYDSGRRVADRRSNFRLKASQSSSRVGERPISRASAMNTSQSSSGYNLIRDASGRSCCSCCPTETNTLMSLSCDRKSSVIRDTTRQKR